MDGRAVLALFLLLFLIAETAPAYQCAAVVGSGLQNTDCMKCISDFVTKLLWGELNLVSYSAVSEGNKYTYYVSYKNLSARITLEYSFYTYVVKEVDNTTALLRLIHELSIDLIKQDKAPICVLTEIAKSSIGDYVCYDKEKNVFYQSKVKEHEMCAEIHTIEDLKKIVMYTKPLSPWDILTNIWSNFVGILGLIGTLFINGIIGLTWIFYMTFYAIVAWGASAVATIISFIILAAPVILAIISWLPWIMMVTALIVITDSFQRAIRQKTFEPLLNVPRRIYAIYVKPLEKVIELAKNIFQAVQAGMDLASRALSTIIAILKHILSFIFG